MSVRIGIDTGKKTAIGISHKGKLIDLINTDFWGCYDIITKEYNPKDIKMITVEISNTTYLYSIKGKNLSSRATGKVGQNVGAVKRESQLLISRFAELGYTVRGVRPLGKIDKAKFNKLTGWDKKSNEHTRDAGMLSLLN